MCPAGTYRSGQASGIHKHSAEYAATTGTGLAAAGTALAAERTESLEAEEMPSVFRLVSFPYREGCSRDACKAGWVSARAGRMSGVPSD